MVDNIFEDSLVDLERVPWSVWGMLILPSILLFFITSIFSIYIGFIAKGNREIIGKIITQNIPYILILNHSIIFFILLFLLRKNSLSLKYIGLKMTSPKNFLIDIFIGVMIGVFLFMVFSLIFIFLEKITGTGLFKPSQNFPYFDFLISGIVFGGIVEELVYRGYGITFLKTNFGNIQSILITSLFFSLLHWGQGIIGLFHSFIIGLFLGILFIWRKNLVPCIFAHATVNFIIIFPMVLKIKTGG